mmetsp:Transcript_10027/g.39020  ORF Transcript_10027/g.39020 Transcript_10027/m.39020 type:complete len:256 (+) Transcript_10027:73-840(+)
MSSVERRIASATSASAPPAAAAMAPERPASALTRPRARIVACLTQSGERTTSLSRVAMASASAAAAPTSDSTRLTSIAGSAVASSSRKLTTPRSWSIDARSVPARTRSNTSASASAALPRPSFSAISAVVMVTNVLVRPRMTRACWARCSCAASPVRLLAASASSSALRASASAVGFKVTKASAMRVKGLTSSARLRAMPCDAATGMEGGLPAAMRLQRMRQRSAAMATALRAAEGVTSTMEKESVALLHFLSAA